MKRLAQIPAPVWIFAAAAALYARTVFFQLTLLDDNFLLQDKLAFLQDLRNLPGIFLRGAFLGRGADVYYRPLLIASEMLDARIGGGSLGLFHFTNLILHGACAVLAYTLFRKTGRGALALPLALVYTVHPALAQSVAWMPGRTDTLLTLFVLASVIAFIDAGDQPGWKAPALHLLFFALALLSKELAVAVPVLCASAVVLLSRGPHPARSRSAAMIGAGWVALLAAWLLIRRLALSGPDAYTLLGTASSAAANLPAFLFYLGKCLLPFNLSTYPILADASPLYGLAAVALIAGAARASKGMNLRFAAWGAIWFLAALLPSFAYPDAAITPVFFEYRLQLPLIGLLLLLSETAPAQRLALPAGFPAFAAVFCALFALAWLNTGNYRDADAFWTSAVGGSPHSAFAQKQLGVVRYFQKDFRRAEARYRRALAINPREPLARNNLGLLRLESGDFAGAAEEFRGELAHNPGYDDARFNLGLAFARRGMLPEAEIEWRRTLQITPEHPDAHANLARLLADSHRELEAREHCLAAAAGGGRLSAEFCATLKPR